MTHYYPSQSKRGIKGVHSFFWSSLPVWKLARVKLSNQMFVSLGEYRTHLEHRVLAAYSAGPFSSYEAGELVFGFLAWWPHVPDWERGVCYSLL